MKLHAFSIALFASLACLSLTSACDDGDDGTDEAADTNTDNADTTTDTGAMDVTCDVFCEAYITQCLQGGTSTEFETNDLCLTACAAWDQTGVNCRNEQIGAGMCDQAGNMGSTCN